MNDTTPQNSPPHTPPIETPDAAEPAAKVRVSAPEWRAIASLSSIYAFRMLGIFLLLPVLALYVQSFGAVSPLWVGLAMGAYGLSQALFQVPYGLWSDRYGRKKIISLGLVLYAAGSVMGIGAGSVLGVVVARLVQGAGAISGPVTALLADLTRTEIRTRAMAIIGISIGASFTLSLLVAPWLDGAIGVRGIFALMAAFALLSLVILHLKVPTPPADRVAAPRVSVRKALLPGLWVYYSGIFMLNLVLVATFTVIPGILRDVHHLDVALHGRWYLGVFLMSLPLTAFMVVLAERGRPRLAFVLSALCLAGSLALMAAHAAQFVALVGCLVGFFAGFNFLEARLPARLSQQAPVEVRGAALSVFATAQFLGSFVGGAGAGLLLSVGGVGTVLAAQAVVCLVWVVTLGRAVQ